MFAQFQERDFLFDTQNLLSDTRDDAESDDYSTMPSLISE